MVAGCVVGRVDLREWEHVAYVGTVSKSLAPALRLGWFVLPPRLVQDGIVLRRMLDFASPALDQLALARLIEVGEYERHIRRGRATYRRRRDAMIEATTRLLPDCGTEGIPAGVHFVLRLPPQVDDLAIAARAAADRIVVEPISRYNLSHHSGPGLLLGYGRIHESLVVPAVQALAAVIARS